MGGAAHGRRPDSVKNNPSVGRKPVLDLSSKESRGRYLSNVAFAQKIRELKTLAAQRQRENEEMAECTFDPFTASVAKGIHGPGLVHSSVYETLPRDKCLAPGKEANASANANINFS